MTKFFRVAVLAAFTGFFTVQHADARCWTYGDCARKCARTWRQFDYASARDCVARFPCSQYPRQCSGSSAGGGSSFNACLKRGERAGWGAAETAAYCSRHR
jgi:hypothetical protein